MDGAGGGEGVAGGAGLLVHLASAQLWRVSHARSPPQKHSPNARNPAKLTKSRPRRPFP
jgi:hypothetical protein